MDFATELDTTVANAIQDFELSLGLREPPPPAPPSPEELTALAEADRLQRETDERVRKLAEGDRAEWASHFPVPGRHTILPYTEAQEADKAAAEDRRQDAEHLRAMANARAADAEAKGDHATAEALRSGSQPSSNGPRLHPDYPLPDPRIRPSSGSRINPFTGRG
jgi:hypothetical protein